MDIAFWFRLHTLGWTVWVPATGAFALAIAWADSKPERRHSLPWLCLRILLIALGAEDLLSEWHRVYWQSRPVWGAGELASLLVGVLPLAGCLLMRRLTPRLPRRLWPRALALAAPALLLRLVAGAHMYHWIQRGLLD